MGELFILSQDGRSRRGYTMQQSTRRRPSVPEKPSVETRSTRAPSHRQTATTPRGKTPVNPHSFTRGRGTMKYFIGIPPYLRRTRGRRKRRGVPGLKLYGVVPGGLVCVRLDAGGERPLLPVQAELAHRAKLGEEGVPPLIAPRQALHVCCDLGGGKVRPGLAC